MTQDYEAAKTQAAEMIRLTQQLPALLIGEPLNPDGVDVASRLAELTAYAIKSIERQTAWLEGWQAARQHFDR